MAVNRPGYYNLPVDVVDSIKGHADVYHAVVEALGIKKVQVFGVSMGGLSALYYAQKYSTQSLMLWCPLTGEYHPKQEALDSPFAKLFLSPYFQDVISWLMRRAADLSPKLLLYPLLQAEVNLEAQHLQRILKQILNDPFEKAQALKFMHATAPMSKIYTGMMDELEKAAQPQPFDWAQINMPVLAYASKVDNDVPQDHFERLEQELVNGQLKFMQVAGHFVWWGEEGKQVQAETLAFFQQHRDAAAG